MKTMRIILASLLVVLTGYATTSRAEDIDIYSGLGSAVNTPNVLFVMDNSANFEASSGGVTCMQQADGSLLINAAAGTATAMSGKVGGIEQCALWNVVKNLPVNADGTARVNIGFMVYNGPNVHDVNNANCGGGLGGCLTQPMIAMTAANKTGVLSWIASWNTSPSAATGNVKAAGKATAATMQEAWAYYKGTTGLSTRSYSGIQPAGGCQKNFIIYIGNAFSSASSPGDPSSGGPLNALTTAINTQPQPAGLTATQWTAKKTTWSTPILNTVNTACGTAPGSYNFASPSSNHSENGGDYADEWARFMQQSDIYTTTPDGIQSITTYTVGLLDPTSCKPEYAALLNNMATYGGGKYFATTSYDTIVNAILKILNEVQAVNSVFSSSSLPVSVNAQGTYLNQIYMGMFRPDPSALPRWAGNLKQYKFIINSATGALQLGDSLGNPALDSSGTGFLSPNAISFWTCTNLTTPYNNPYFNATPANLTAAQIALLGSNFQNCTDPSSGFWVNDPSSANAVAQGFDLPDGERVERGGTAQQLRQINLTDNYATAAGSSTNPRSLYTYCPSGTGCVNDLTNAANIFATTNASLTATAFGSTLTANIASLSRSGTTVTVATTGNHGFSNGDSITIANASPSNYNGTFTITVVDATHFTYSIIVYPPTPATGSYTASLAGVPVNVSTLTRSGNTVTVTTAAAHGFLNGTTVVIAGATPTIYNGSFVITSVPTTTSFTYTVNEQPPTVAGSGTATITTKTTGTGCPCTTTATINAWNAATPGVQRTLGSTTVTVNTNTNMVNSPSWVGKSFTIANVLDSNGGSVAAYNVTSTIVSVSGNSFTFTLPTALSPTTPATGTITAGTASTLATLTSLSRVGSTATATATAHGFTNGQSVSIGGTAGANESAYLGTFTISNVTANTFDYPVVTTPTSPATGAMTATRSSGLNAANLNDLINWVRGQDNFGDEFGPGGSVTVRPSVHGDVLHSRPTVINYGGSTIGITGTSDSGSVRTATASAADVAKIGTTGATVSITFSNGNTCTATVASTTTFTYSTSNCGVPGAQSVITGSSNVVVYYGDNGGVFHAVNGNQTAAIGSIGPGDEMWGFIPKEFFLKLNRLRTNSPQLNLPSTPPGILPTPQGKDYFIDGITGLYQLIDSNGNTTKAVLYLSMRRGGNFIYALDVTNPAVPTVLWKVDNTTANMSELGQTWSQPKVAKVAGHTNPVLIFGAGYDANNEDNEPPTADASGRGIFVLDALTGALVWKATPSAGATSCTGNATQASCVVSGMNYSIPADITLVDRDRDGLVDRLYAADVGGNIWRVDLEPSGNSTPDFWRVYQLAALGCWSGVCSIPTTITQRKFFYPPEVITTTAYDAVIAGAGDREHPLYVNTSTQRYNRVFLVKDPVVGNNASGATTYPITLTGTNSLFDATSTPWDGSLNGYFITLAAGEKVVNAPLVTAGMVYFGTNQPTAPSSTSCTSNLGIAKGYQLQPFTGKYTNIVFAGGGLPPSPVSGVVSITTASGTQLVPFLIGGGNPDCVGSDCSSALGGQKPPISVPTSRTRTYWYQEID
ncbi:MAG TPA: PilC/PilY family type IV pilus protein [Gallionella sp.]|nr:PilC/PilY family type IV pilus protein [Gallionella sp.]